eukprot:9152323-Pyramimonas_sp.AAC.1
MARTGNSLVWYLNPSSLTYTAIDAMKDIVSLFVEHQIAFHFLIRCTKYCSGVHKSVPRLAPSSALSAYVADTFNQVGSDTAQTYLA